jgi:hypothetical protein
MDLLGCLPIVAVVRPFGGNSCGGIFPNLFLPRAKRIGKLERGLWMGGISLKSDHLSVCGYWVI